MVKLVRVDWLLWGVGMAYVVDAGDQVLRYEALAFEVSCRAKQEGSKVEQPEWSGMELSARRFTESRGRKVTEWRQRKL